MAEENNKKKTNKQTRKTDKKKPRAAKLKETEGTKEQGHYKDRYRNMTDAKYKTHTGEILTSKQERFIELYIELGNQRQAFLQAGYKDVQVDANANRLIRNKKIADEIRYRMEESKRKSIATADEILQYFSDVMNGKIKDQFGLDATLSDRTKAASELAKRLIDIPNKIEAIASGKGTGQATVTISLDWEGMEGTKDEGEEEQEKE